MRLTALRILPSLLLIGIVFSSAPAQGMPAFTRFDSLFIVAATGEPRFSILRDSCRHALIESDTSTLAYLLNYRLVNQTARQSHYVRELFAAISDSGKNVAPREFLRKGLPEVPDSVKSQLLYIGSRLGDTAFASVAREYLDSNNEEVRRNAVRSLGAYPNQSHIPLLLKGIEKTSGPELHQRLWALGEQDRVSDWRRLFFALSDASLANRQAARRIIARSAPGWPDVEKLLAAHPVSVLEAMLLAAGMQGDKAAIFWMQSYAELDPLSRRFVPAAFPGQR